MNYFIQIRCWCSVLLTLLCLGMRVRSLQYLTGDFLTDPREKSPDGFMYPKHEVESIIFKELPRLRRSRSLQFMDDPWTTRKTLLEWHTQFRINHQRSFEGRGIVAPSRSNSVSSSNNDDGTKTRSESSKNSSSAGGATAACNSIQDVPQRLCKTKFNTTAPMYGVSLTSGKPVTIVQKFPDLLQQVIFEVCASETCDIIHGDCVQTYVPYLFLVIPLGPVTLTGQDYVLVESGCVCRPKYAGGKAPPNPLDAIGFEVEQ